MRRRDQLLIPATAFALEQLRDGADGKELRRGLVRMGLDPEAARSIASAIERRSRDTRPPGLPFGGWVFAWTIAAGLIGTLI